MTDAGQPVIRYERVRKEYDDGTVAVEELDLDVAAHELLALVGPSGCGKSTTLRMANRLVEPTSGRVLVEGEDIAGTDPVELRRRMGYVIQNVGLFPHRTVEQNVATVPHLLGWARERTRGRVADLLELVGLAPGTYARRYPHQLSGGERQRVGVARALAADPPVLLMDEPFGAVDPVGRRRLQMEFGRIRRELGTTVVLVTHDIDEAVRLADRVAVFSRGGHLEQLADPVRLLARPATAMVADFVGRGAAVRLLGLGRLGRADVRPDGGLGAGRAGDGGGGDGTSATDAVVLGAPLDEVLGALATAPGGALPVRDDAGGVVGVVTADAVLASVRRMTDGAADGADGADGAGGAGGVEPAGVRQDRPA
ncbi:ATP-binding cassette domain-containing protein [Cellulomonas sp. ATA003]|uniref:ABC transporter ATP-binding protein n=1 Tax=Cellulomonas sp. ATA003 TaxID=3073064 RepID=UPI0028731B9E|nr:ATP-binding cassette domain-containing protein [Cellulomonas sp. ATA003]WNB86711.1 ATP-binding cassette domain-containing protein [Cellulomonas sp. ATA003]